MPEYGVVPQRIRRVLLWKHPLLIYPDPMGRPSLGKAGPLYAPLQADFRFFGLVKHIPVQAAEGLLHFGKREGQIHADVVRRLEAGA